METDGSPDDEENQNEESGESSQEVDSNSPESEDATPEEEFEDDLPYASFMQRRKPTPTRSYRPSKDADETPEIETPEEDSANTSWFGNDLEKVLDSTSEEGDMEGEAKVEPNPVAEEQEHAG